MKRSFHLFFLLIFTTVSSGGALAAVIGSSEGIVGSRKTMDAQFNRYTAATENLTKVANAVTVQSYSLSKITTVRAGLGLTKPVWITVRYNSYNGSAFSDVVWGTYNEARGLRLVINDQEGVGTLRQGNVRIELFEPDDPAAVGRTRGTSFDLPEMRLNLDPLYDVNIRPTQVTRIQDCPTLTSSDVAVRWFSPDDQKHEAVFRFGTNKTALVPGSQWSAQAVSASRNYHMPIVGLYGFHIPSSPTNVNLLPAPLAAGRPIAAQEIKFQMNEPNRHCTAQVQYIIDRRLKRYVDPSSPAAQVITQQPLQAK